MLEGSVRKHLRGLAHDLEPAVRTGKEGLTETVLGAIDKALAAHELIKVKLVAERHERRQMATTIEQRLACEQVGAIGQIAILYRQQEDPERRRILLPGAERHGSEPAGP